MITFMMV